MTSLPPAEQEYCKQVPSVCAANATCTASNTTTGYNCACPRGFHGNPYNLSGIGCLDNNKCNFANSCAQLARCINMPGSYDCSCHSGYFGDGFANGTGCQLTTENSSDNHNVPLIAGLSTAAALIGLGGTLLTVFCFKRESKMRNRFARRNIEALGSMKDVFIALSDGESTVTLFSFKELEKATKGFADDQKVGTGGFGTVYKGKLETGLTIAVKKTNHVGISGLQQFLNEVRVLSQVNHRNLVKLHGCCVETEIPMLVYEYVPNGNLSELLRGEKPGIHLNWASRMQIAIETAEAITYLHSSANPPIYHRDVKSANILLDDKFSVKVSDFGISRLIQSDATHVSTAVQGTPGYLDPEYFHSYHLTEKSDVYSFGVILLELVTSKYPLDFNRDQKEVNLTAMCIPQIKKGNVEAIVDPQLLHAMDFAETLHEIECVANLATHCLSACRDDRPSMKQVTEELHHIKGTTSQWRADGPSENEFGPEMLEKLAYFRQFLNLTQSFSKPPSPTDPAANSPSVCREAQKNSR
jgi:serine/threonine protein kinase